MGNINKGEFGVEKYRVINRVKALSRVNEVGEVESVGCNGQPCCRLAIKSLMPFLIILEQEERSEKGRQISMSKRLSFLRMGIVKACFHKLGK